MPALLTPELDSLLEARQHDPFAWLGRHPLPDGSVLVRALLPDTSRAEILPGYQTTVWAYNGLTANNPYPYKIWTHIADGRGLWTGLAVTSVPETSLVNGLPPKLASIAAPQPEHWWSPTPLPKPQLSAPRAQKRVAAGDRFTVSGTLSPLHPAGAHSVELQLSRWDGSSWVPRRTVLTTNRDSGSVTRWAATFALAKAGRWKLVAYAPADADHSAATSSPAHVTVVR